MSAMRRHLRCARTTRGSPCGAARAAALRRAGYGVQRRAVNAAARSRERAERDHEGDDRRIADVNSEAMYQERRSRAVPSGERPDQQGRSGKAGEEDAKPCPSSGAREPAEAEPGVSQCSRNSSANGFVAATSSATTPSASSVADVPGELLLGSYGPVRGEPGPGDEPAGRREQDEQGEVRAAAGASPARGLERSSGRAAPLGPGADEGRGQQRTCSTDPEPEAEPAPVGAEGRAVRGMRASPAAGEQVDRGDGEREQHRDQRELDRPAAHRRRCPR